MTKADLAVFREHLDRKFIEVDHRFEKLQLTLTVRMGLIAASGISIAIAALGWLIKVR